MSKPILLVCFSGTAGWKGVFVYVSKCDKTTNLGEENKYELKNLYGWCLGSKIRVPEGSPSLLKHGIYQLNLQMWQGVPQTQLAPKEKFFV